MSGLQEGKSLHSLMFSPSPGLRSPFRRERDRALNSLLSSIDRNSIHGRINDDGSRIWGFQRLMNPPRRFVREEPVERPGKGRVQGNPSQKPHDPTENFFRLKPLDQPLRDVEFGTIFTTKSGQSGPGQREQACRGHTLPDNAFGADKHEDRSPPSCDVPARNDHRSGPRSEDRGPETLENL